MKDAPNLFDVKPKAKRKASPSAPDQVVHKLIMLWVSLFTRRFGERPVVTGRDGKALKDLVKHYDAATVGQRLEQYLALDDVYLHDAGFPLSLLPSVWNRLAVKAASAKPRQVYDDAERTDAYLRSLKR